MDVFLLLAIGSLWFVVFFLGFLLLGALRAVALLRWRLDQLEATSPRRLGRSGGDEHGKRYYLWHRAAIPLWDGIKSFVGRIHFQFSQQ